MKKAFYLLVLLAFLTGPSVNAQVIIGSQGTPNPAAGLDLSPAAALNMGFLPPSIELDLDPQVFVLNGSTEDAVKAVGMIVYNTASPGPDSKGPGLYVWDGFRWNLVSSPPNTGTTSECSFVMDVDGNVYQARKFGTQCWMTSNLRTTRAKTGTPLTDVRLNPAYFEHYPAAALVVWENNQVTFHPETNASVNLTTRMPEAAFMIATAANPSGTLYTWDYASYANQFGLYYTQAAARDACPDGWKLPANSDWNTLATFLGGAAEAGKKMKANANKYASNNNGAAKPLPAANVLIGDWGGYLTTDPKNSGFLALPSGYVILQAQVGGLGSTKESNAAIGSVSITPAAGKGFSQFAYWWAYETNTARAIAAKNHGTAGVVTTPDELATATSVPTSNLYTVRCVKE